MDKNKHCEYNPLISIVVPVYNVENYLNRCIDSIVNQSYHNIEIILVDDGSTDSSGHICDTFSEADRRVTVIHKLNGGLSDARNHGIEASKGEYICFIDSDDLISQDYVKYLLVLLIQSNADISMGRYQTFSDTIQFDQTEKHMVSCYSGKEVIDCLIGADYVTYTVAWNKLYKKSLFESIRFPVGKINEDEATMYKLFYIATKVVYSDKVVYGYYMRANSITKSTFSRKRLDYLDIAEERAEFFKKCGDERHYEDFLYVYAMGILSYITKVKNELGDLELARQLQQKFRSLERILYKSSITPKRKIAMLVLGVHPNIYTLFAKLTR